MAGIKIPLTDLLAKLRTLTITNGDGFIVAPHVRVWNNQIAYLEEGKLEAFPMPAFFVEIVNTPVYENIGQYFRSSDLSFKIHIAHEYYDAGDGTFEQDLPVFDLRDQIVANITGYRLTACSPLNCMNEGQDFEHTNVYHFILDFVCNFTDSIGSKYDPNNPKAYIDSTPPTNLEVDMTITSTVTNNFNTMAIWTAHSTKYTASVAGELVFTVLDDLGNLIIGANIVNVVKEIKTLVTGQYSFNPTTSIMSLIAGLELAAGETVFIIYQKNN